MLTAAAVPMRMSRFLKAPEGVLAVVLLVVLAVVLLVSLATIQ